MNTFLLCALCAFWFAWAVYLCRIAWRYRRCRKCRKKIQTARVMAALNDHENGRASFRDVMRVAETCDVVLEESASFKVLVRGKLQAACEHRRHRQWAQAMYIRLFNDDDGFVQELRAR